MYLQFYLLILIFSIEDKYDYSMTNCFIWNTILDSAVSINGKITKQI